jgi:hypothetical protein
LISTHWSISLLGGRLLVVTRPAVNANCGHGFPNHNASDRVVVEGWLAVLRIRAPETDLAA